MASCLPSQEFVFHAVSLIVFFSWFAIMYTYLVPFFLWLSQDFTICGQIKDDCNKNNVKECFREKCLAIRGEPHVSFVFKLPCVCPLPLVSLLFTSVR